MRDADAGAIEAMAQAKAAQQTYAGRVWGYRQAEAVAAMIYVGRELGLFEAMADAGPMSADELATKTGLHPRWLLEWMRLQAAAKILAYEPVDRFMLPPEATDILARPASRAYAADSFTGGYPMEQLTGLMESFRTGIGKTYESDGPCAVTKSEARHIKTARNQVVPVMIPALDGVREKLERGALVADVGCGDGALAVALAQAFPRSTIHAMDPNAHAIAHVDGLVRQHALANLSTFVAPAENLPGEDGYDLIITFDCVHDMTDPQAAIGEIHRRLKPDGTWFIKDIRSKPNFEDNLRNPMLAMMYSFSLFTCMSSAMSEPGGAGLGTLGFNPEIAERMSRQAGFTRFRMLDFKDPGNLYYEVRP
ncbi:MAG: methyltransferase domain-containing protein [Pseudomonadota bacterium]|nr:methyltransferase domain-containing protein [Pseudomonadota bacterium]